MDVVAEAGAKYQIGNLHTDDAKIAKLEHLFQHRKNPGDFLLPNADFYQLDLNGMASAIFDWLGFESKDKLYLDYASDFEESGLGDAAGVYKEIDDIHYIFLNSKKVTNSFQAAAVLSHELMHYLLMGVHRYLLEDTLENEKFTDIATVFNGLGVIVTNGFEFKSGWAKTVGALMLGFISINTQSLSFGYYSPHQYAGMLYDFAKTFDIPNDQFAGYLLPWTRHFLPTSLKNASRLTANKPDIVNLAQKIVWKQRAISMAVLVILIPVAIFIYSHNSVGGSNIPPDVQQQLNSMQSNLSSLKGQLDECQANLNAARSTLDRTDQTAVDNFNSNVDTCNNTRDQYNSEVDSYNSLLNQYK